MKKLIIIGIVFFNLLPTIKDHKLSFGPAPLAAQGFGDEGADGLTTAEWIAASDPSGHDMTAYLNSLTPGTQVSSTFFNNYLTPAQQSAFTQVNVSTPPVTTTTGGGEVVGELVASQASGSNDYIFYSEIVTDPTTTTTPGTYNTYYVYDGTIQIPPTYPGAPPNFGNPYDPVWAYLYNLPPGQGLTAPPGSNPAGTDVNGFFLSRTLELMQNIIANQDALIPCDQLQPLDDVNGAGLMYKRVEQYQVPQTVLNQINADAQAIAAANPTGTTAPGTPQVNLSVQKIENGSSAISGAMNCDYFPVHISKLPPFQTQAQIVEYFRTHMTDFVDQAPPGPGVRFSPYQQGNWTDPLFMLPGQQSVGGLVHVHMINDGTVVESGYYQGVINGIEKDRFVFTTMTSPVDYNHPVSGNREFGIFGSPATGYTFYTMGVDRTSDYLFNAINPLVDGFGAADALWSNMAKNMAAYITSLGGVATVMPKVVSRPNWSDVRDYLEGKIDFATLKKRMGCP
jgi:hypothetical protein